MKTQTQLQACIFNLQRFSIHDGPGIRTVVFFKGCPLRCKWCSNPESQNKKPEKMWNNFRKKHMIIGEYKTIDEVVSEVMKDIDFYKESGGGVTLSGGEVLYQAQFATELLKVLKEKGIHTATETSGYAQTNIFATHIKHVDTLYFDVKHYDPKKHQTGTGVTNKLILKNLSYALKHHDDLTVRIPIIPRFNDSPQQAKQFALLFNHMGVKKIELLPFHQFGQKKYTDLNREYTMEEIPQLHTEDLDYFKNIIEKHNIFCFIQ